MVSPSSTVPNRSVRPAATGTKTTSPWPRTADGLRRAYLTIIGVAPGGGGSGGVDGHTEIRSGPTPAGSAQSAGQQAVVDFPRHGEPVERRWRQEQARVVREPIRRGIDASFHRGDDAVAIRVDAGDLGGIGAEQLRGSNEARRASTCR